MFDHPVALLKIGHDIDDLVNPVVSRQVHRANVDLNVVVQEVRCKPTDLLRPSGGPHACLPIGANLGNDSANLRLETHVQHAISLIEDKISDTAKVSPTSIEHVDQTAWRSNADLDTTAQITNLGTLGNTAVDTGIADTGGFAELGHFGLDLNCKLTSRGEDKNDRSVARRKERLGVDVDDRRKAVSQGLSGTSLGNTDNIATRESHGPALGLDRGRGRETLSLDFRQDVLREAGFIKGLNGTRDIPSVDRHLMLLAIVLNVTF